MQIQTPREKPPTSTKDYHSSVDTSRPFRSVKEAVAIFGERFLGGEIYSPRPFSFPKQEAPSTKKFSPSPHQIDKAASWSWGPQESKELEDGGSPPLVDTLKKLEAELEETKMELKLLKERESETEVALASLNAELHKNMSKIAQAEATAAAKAMASRSSSSSSMVLGVGGTNNRNRVKDGGREKDVIIRMENPPTLSEILTAEDQKEGGWFGGRKKERKMMKKKPIIPLVGDLFSRNKGTSTTALHNPLYSSSHVHWS